jgi:hypothetical protein
MMMSFDKPIRRMAIVGTGVIGASWAAQYAGAWLRQLAEAENEVLVGLLGLRAEHG